MKKQKGFYDRYREEQLQKQKEENLRRKYNISDDKYIVIENSRFDKFLYHISNFMTIIIKIITYSSILILAGIGSTVILNEPLRNTFFEVIKTIF